MTQVREGDHVQVHYTGRLANGTVFGTSRDGEPIAFTAGSQEVVRGVSRGVVGMSVGETKAITVPPEEAYGPRHDGLRRTVPRAQLPEGAEVGAFLKLTAGDQEFGAVLVEIGEQEAIVDCNHPLAGKTLVYEVEVVAIDA